MELLFQEVVAAASYSLVGLALMAVGYIVIDILTPGKLRTLIWEERNRNASLLLTSNILGLGLIVVGAIWASHGDLVRGLIATAIFGLIGIAAMTLSFVVLDLLTPGKLGEIVTCPDHHPAVWVNCGMHVAVGGMVAMALS
ncbi:DUF350 domain-containing protein [Natronoglycomyces albus]|uniref:DUF350 domain-containing protein n=1 Tax=Natronoglycomyces albus TaxID=2811108 RepID=A0A895XL97_9ACTN|nr:DUF350 domain-containing protein [Natronoglycomyces albus]QSB06481.1 DUF350 domain-containing protein [Natronoglycomyces albus]